MKYDGGPMRKELGKTNSAKRQDERRPTMAKTRREGTIHG